MAIHHVLVNPIKCKIPENFFTQATSDVILDGSIVAISLYDGCVPTFQVRMGNGTLWANVPPHKCFGDMAQLGAERSLTDLVYHNCPGGRAELFQLQLEKVACFFKGPKLWVTGKYLLTVDWLDQNLCLHLILLDDGHFAWLPNHKVNASGIFNLPAGYKKDRNDYRV